MLCGGKTKFASLNLVWGPVPRESYLSEAGAGFTGLAGLAGLGHFVDSEAVPELQREPPLVTQRGGQAPASY